MSALERWRAELRQVRDAGPCTHTHTVQDGRDRLVAVECSRCEEGLYLEDLDTGKRLATVAEARGFVRDHRRCRLPMPEPWDW